MGHCALHRGRGNQHADHHQRPSPAFTGDWGFLQIVLGYLLGRIVVGIIFLPRYFRGELLTAYEVIGERFGRGCNSSPHFFFFSARRGRGVRVFAVSIVVGIAIGTRDVTSIAIICILTLIYTLEAEWPPSSGPTWWIALYVTGTIVSVILLGHRIPGGWPAIHTVATAAGKLTIFHFAFSLSQTYTFWAGLMGGCFLPWPVTVPINSWSNACWRPRTCANRASPCSAAAGLFWFSSLYFLPLGRGCTTSTAALPTARLRRIRPCLSGVHCDRDAPWRGWTHGCGHPGCRDVVSERSGKLLSSSSMVDFYMAWKPHADERERARLSRIMTLFWAALLFVPALLSRGGGHVVRLGCRSPLSPTELCWSLPAGDAHQNSNRNRRHDRHDWRVGNQYTALEAASCLAAYFRQDSSCFQKCLDVVRPTSDLCLRLFWVGP